MTEKLELLEVEDAKVWRFDARWLKRSALELVGHAKLRKSSTVKTGIPTEVG